MAPNTGTGQGHSKVGGKPPRGLCPFCSPASLQKAEGHTPSDLKIAKNRKVHIVAGSPLNKPCKTSTSN